MLKLSAPMRSAPENVVTATSGRVKERGETGQRKTGWEQWGRPRRGVGEEWGRGRGERVSSLQSDLFAKSGHNESIMSPLIRESVWGPANWA